jgi:hypothetical protein
VVSPIRYISPCGQSGSGGEHPHATDAVIRIYSDDDESSGALANTDHLLPLSTLPMKRSKNGALILRSSELRINCPSTLGKCLGTTSWGTEAINRLVQKIEKARSLKSD